MLARVTSDLREAHIEEQAADAGVREHRIENLPTFRISVPAFIDIFPNDTSGERGAVAVCLVDRTRERVRNAARVRFTVA